MSRKPFTPEEVIQLRSNPYVRNATQNKISFTTDFKQRFWDAYELGKTPRDILMEMGFDVDLLGEPRIRGIIHHIQEQARSGAGFSEGYHWHNKHEPAIQSQPVSKRILRLEHELAYTKQELEFIKKIILADREANRKCSSKHNRASNSESSEK